MEMKRWSDGRTVSCVGLGTWQLGADWGEVSEADAHAVIDTAVGEGVTFLDTADVYGDGRSEQIIGSYLAQNPGLDLFVATKMGRRVEQVPEAYNLEAFRGWTDRSRRNLGVERLDLVQLHCPPSAVYEDDKVFDALDTLVEEGAIKQYGVSVEKRSEALRALERPGLASIQIIVNAFRLAPLDDVIPAAAERGVSIIARVPLASGLLSGRYTLETTFAENDHRTFNRHGEAFDVGETFAGVDYARGVAAAQELAAAVPAGMTLAQASIAWLAQQEGITTVIPGGRSPEQARSNASAGELGPLPASFDAAVRDVYERFIKVDVHDRW
ncbi:aryl-alcohol dehydrogenase-like predicted oxidoreductase [Flavimobilis soli]|uniref:Aryl-alcohol dehydrogenase-like predicted oxidoreductase n=2 Tax=Flavimobilis soli TaxID=442709 RepID=A0A2A9EGJ4_9MICO|nr:aldo/keto reductase [Flavimobilis soli]PFG37651.1 aryl-alcohol dehydrogenase-like predicted oxidoreductase [Flavimobilis soli]